MTRNRIILIDKETKRAGAIASALSRLGCDVQHVRCPSEIERSPPPGTAVLAADEPGSLQRVLAHMAQLRSSPKVVLFSSEPTTLRALSTVAAGAADFIGWPCNPSVLLAAIVAVLGSEARSLKA